MEYVDYSERAKWYHIETFDQDQDEFLLRLMKTTKCCNPLIIPCSSGGKFQVLSSISHSVIGYDNDSQMLYHANKMVEINSLRNISVLYGNMLDFPIPNSVDIIFILNEALQMFSPNSQVIPIIIQNILNRFHGILVVELYDFHNPYSQDRLRYFSRDTINHIERDFIFCFDNFDITRFHKSILTSTGVDVTYYYKLRNRDDCKIIWKKANFVLFNIDITQLINWASSVRNISYSIFSSYNINFNPTINQGKRVLVIDCK